MLASPFKIKICGITSPGDAEAAVEAGADALGLNFYESSRRYVEPRVARNIEQMVGNSATLVGLFVNHPAEFVNDCIAGLSLRWVQLHGDEPPEYLLEVDSKVSIMRAYRASAWQQVLDDLAACFTAGRVPDAVLLDADVVGSYGGTGHTADWQRLAERRPEPEATAPPVILAGGLTPENVAEAIALVHPDGVDVASGVEKAAGQKDPARMQSFVEAAKSAFTAL